MAILKTPTGVVHRLNGDTVTIGRGAANAIPLADSACSSRHAQFVEDETGWRVEDRGSLNGTFVNDQRVQTARLGHGDRVQVGATELVFEFDGGSTPAPADAALSGGSGYSSSFLQSIVGDRDPDSETPGGIWGQSLLIDDDASDGASGSHIEFKPIDPAAPTPTQTMTLTSSARAKGRSNRRS